MVTLVTWLAIAAAGAAGPAPVSVPAALPECAAVRSALAKEGFPWYDGRADAAKPVLPGGEWAARFFKRWFGWLDRIRLPRIGSPSLGYLSVGELLMVGVLVLALAVLLAVLAELWRRYRPIEAELAPAGASRAHARGRIEGLPAGVRPETDDPWAEALRCRAEGDLARAIVCLFAHQLLTLNRLRLLRLAPGRTARQLVRTIEDRQYHGLVVPTLRLFETVYYGQRIPSSEAFEAVWTAAESFESRVAGSAS
jgi:hypothetical protein